MKVGRGYGELDAAHLALAIERVEVVAVEPQLATTRRVALVRAGPVRGRLKIVADGL